MHEDDAQEIFEGKWYQHPPMRNALISGLITGVTFTLSYLGLIPEGIEIAAFLAAILIGAYHWTKEGLEELIEEKEIGIDILMLAAAIGSAILGLWDEAAFLVFLYGAAEGLEEYTYAKTRASIRKLMDLAPKEAQILIDGKEKTIPATELKIDDVLLVRPGETIATDGVIIEGRSSVNEAPVTGESMPVEKKAGMKVFAATLNQDGALQINVTTAFEDNTLSKMIHLVEEAQEKKGKTQQFIEKFGNRYSPVVLLSAVLMIVAQAILGDPGGQWTMRAVVLLVAAAPCALVMSTPVAVAAAISKAGLNGILFKGGASLDNLSKVKVLAMDKTGTLTRGEPVVTDIVSLDGNSDNQLLNLAYSIEKYSEHPLAKAIVKKAEELEGTPLPISEFLTMGGYGAKAQIDGEVIYIGKEGLFNKLGIKGQSLTQIDALRKEGKTVVLVGTEKKIHGLLAIRDETRKEAKQFIKDMHKMGIKVVMLTGDSQATAKIFAEELGIDDFRSDLKPEAKVDAIKQLTTMHGSVAMVGDGINDAPALAQSDVGIAMGVAGTDAAIEAADVALMSDDLSKLAFGIKLSKKSRAIGIQNIIFSIGILVVLIPSALIGLMSVAVAVFAHEISELLAVANGLRASRG